MVNYKSTSPYSNTPQTSWYLGRFERKSIAPHYTDVQTIIPLKYNLRPDLLAYDIYGTTDYWWIFMARNLDVIRDPIFDFVTGTEIYVPSPDRLASLVD